MTSDKARKAKVRARMARTGEPYSEAARQLDQSTSPDDLKSLAAAVLPTPVAVMQARHVAAARMHLATAHGLAADHGAPGAVDRHARHTGGGALDAVHARIRESLWDLQQYAERSALASGAIDALPELMKPNDPADQALYPSMHLWCASGPGHTLPQPGQDPSEAETEAGERVRHLLPGPVPTTQLVPPGTSGMNTAKATDIVPGTPAESIWEAQHVLNRYGCDWMYRAGDSPADLAAALDGCNRLFDDLIGTIATVLDEIARRDDEGTLTGVDRAAIDQARAVTDFSKLGKLRSALRSARAAITGARAELPKPRGGRVSDALARTMHGRTNAQIRNALGEEVFINRQIGKVTAPNYTRADALARIMAWMHATGATVYDQAAHTTTDPARAEG
ncbi:hypothetical protein [Nocardia vermiculata]|uniref:Uncharacterized protein n=1 Tax=Nocardia vermiculata TaxID=257274 RepID=A0A846Y7T6_9NOCA|nr:hypothetical protein [Nocardia vermiculata]NKY53930.1 hypothetical protein [Nocardia vermiculata]